MSIFSLNVDHAGRLLRHLAALNVLEETGADTYKPTSFSLALGDEASHIYNVLGFE